MWMWMRCVASIYKKRKRKRRRRRRPPAAGLPSSEAMRSCPAVHRHRRRAQYTYLRAHIVLCSTVRRVLCPALPHPIAPIPPTNPRSAKSHSHAAAPAAQARAPNVRPARAGYSANGTARRRRKRDAGEGCVYVCVCVPVHGYGYMLVCDPEAGHAATREGLVGGMDADVPEFRGWYWWRMRMGDMGAIFW